MLRNPLFHHFSLIWHLLIPSLSRIFMLLIIFCYLNDLAEYFYIFILTAIFILPLLVPPPFQSALHSPKTLCNLDYYRSDTIIHTHFAYHLKNSLCNTNRYPMCISHTLIFYPLNSDLDMTIFYSCLLAISRSH